MDYSCRLLISTALAWLEENRVRFNHHPVIVQGGADYLIFGFSGIDPGVKLVVQERGNFEIHIADPSHQGSSWDIVTEFDVYPAQTDTGLYYCELCPPEKRTYYPSFSELVRQESLVPLLDWTNRTFRKTNWVGLFQYKGATYVKIIEEKDFLLAKKQSDFVSGYPLVKRLPPRRKRTGKL
jgi:hypothetical protein